MDRYSLLSFNNQIYIEGGALPLVSLPAGHGVPEAVPSEPAEPLEVEGICPVVPFCEVEFDEDEFDREALLVEVVFVVPKLVEPVFEPAADAIALATHGFGAFGLAGCVLPGVCIGVVPVGEFVPSLFVVCGTLSVSSPAAFVVIGVGGPIVVADGAVCVVALDGVLEEEVLEEGMLELVELEFTWPAVFVGGATVGVAVCPVVEVVLGGGVAVRGAVLCAAVKLAQPNSTQKNIDSVNR